MALMKFVLLFRLAFFTHIGPAMQSFVVLLHRLLSLMDFRSPPGRIIKPNRAFRRRLARIKKRMRPAPAKRRRTVGINVKRMHEKANALSESFPAIRCWIHSTVSKIAWDRPEIGNKEPDALAIGGQNPHEPSNSRRDDRDPVDRATARAESSPSAGKPVASDSPCSPDLDQGGPEQQSTPPQSIIIYACIRYLSLALLTAEPGAILEAVIITCAGAHAAPASTASGSIHPAGRPTGIRKQRKGRGTKRPSRGDDDNNAGGGDDSDRGGGGGGGDDDEILPPGLLFACPFYKFDSAAHYRCVEKYKLKRYADVKQHICRYHVVKGPYYCPTCWVTWENMGMWEAHIQSRSCQAGVGPEDLFENERDEFKREMLPGANDKDKWYSMWEYLFQGHPRPSSPYVKSGIAEPADLFRQSGLASLRAVLPYLLQRFGVWLGPEQISSLASNVVDIVLPSPPATPQRRRRYPADPSALSTSVMPGSAPLADMYPAYGANNDPTPNVYPMNLGIGLPGSDPIAAMDPAFNLEGFDFVNYGGGSPSDAFNDIVDP